MDKHPVIDPAEVFKKYNWSSIIGQQDVNDSITTVNSLINAGN